VGPLNAATIITVTHNSARWLPRWRDALAAQTQKNFELIVLDNASHPDERPQQGDLPAGARLIQSEDNLGFAAGNNRAAQEAKSPYLILLNPDAFPEADWLARLIALADQHPWAAAIGSTQLRADADNVFDGTGDVMLASGLPYRSNYGKPRGETPPLGETFAACGAAMLVRREAFETVGGFDERYFCFVEDVDLCFRLRLRGHKVLQSPLAIVHHVGGASTGSRSSFARFLGARNRFWTYVKCMPSLLFWPLLPAHLALSAFACTLNVFSGGGFTAWRGLLAGIGSVGAIWRSRREIQRARRVSWTKIATRLAWNPLLLATRSPVIFKIEER
jgi:N-acetylglucosaminyl-diphospho-decaprenol L-rhamnosyltransferase